jgi:hypothetical protein
LPFRVQIDPSIERKFRETAMKKYGYGKGTLNMAAEEAILDWISNEGEKAVFEGDPVKAIEGLLKDINKDSVKLQHESQELWTKKALE